ncbi:hypothetical protein Scep_015114 [Stephania cephalantha]|uniref:Reverse transcriptase Ty1/copia-type domain-containing protein n=1 Tax=Stephania cephalantha TaxID=152367 RepID=A0AAP0J2P4_9MAGN
MEQPKGFGMLGQEKKIKKLVKSLYGLKQVPMQWHEKFDMVVQSFRFKVNDVDKCIYSKLDNDFDVIICFVQSFGFKGNDVDKCIYSKLDNDVDVIICLYVDDKLIFGISLALVEETKRFLSTSFDMKD